MSINQHNYQNTITSSTSEVKNVKRCMLEHNYSKFSKRKITKRDKNVPEVTDIVEIQKPVVELKESLFVKSKANLSSIILPRKWFIELMVNSITFFKLNDTCFPCKRYLEKQLTLNKNSEITFFVNGKKLVPSNFGFVNYLKPSDTLSLQNVIHTFNSIIICPGVLKSDLLNIKLVQESYDRWWHPNCLHVLLDKKSCLCSSCNEILKKLKTNRSQQKKRANTRNWYSHRR